MPCILRDHYIFWVDFFELCKHRIVPLRDHYYFWGKLSGDACGGKVNFYQCPYVQLCTVTPKPVVIQSWKNFGRELGLGIFMASVSFKLESSFTLGFFVRSSLVVVDRLEPTCLFL